jgi:hypothetical protein
MKVPLDLPGGKGEIGDKGKGTLIFKDWKAK